MHFSPGISITTNPLITLISGPYLEAELDKPTLAVISFMYTSLVEYFETQLMLHKQYPIRHSKILMKCKHLLFTVLDVKFPTDGA